MPTEQLLGFGPYRFDLGAEQVWRGKDAIKLTPKALVLLRTFVMRAGELVTKEELLQAGWSQTVVSDDALTTCIQELRRALGDDARQPRYIETVHRRGFRFIGKVVSCQHQVAESQEGAGIPVRALTPLSPITNNGHPISPVLLITDTQQPTPSLPPIADSPYPTPPLAGRERKVAQIQAWLGILRSGWRRGALLLIGLAIIIGVIVLVQNLSLRQPAPPASILPSHPPLTLSRNRAGEGQKLLPYPTNHRLWCCPSPT